MTYESRANDKGQGHPITFIAKVVVGIIAVSYFIAACASAVSNL